MQPVDPEHSPSRASGHCVVRVGNNLPIDCAETPRAAAFGPDCNSIQTAIGNEVESDLRPIMIQMVDEILPVTQRIGEHVRQRRHEDGSVWIVVGSADPYGGPP